MAFGLKLPIHGRSHDPDKGSDPLKFLGRYLHWGTNNDTGSEGLTLNGLGAFNFETGGNAFSTLTAGGGYSIDTGDGGNPGGPYDVRTWAGDVTFDTDGGGFDINATGGDATVSSDNFTFTTTNAACVYEISTFDFAINRDTGGTISFGQNQKPTVEIDNAGMHVRIASGDTLTVYDNGNNPIFEVREDGSVHILTGSTIVADL